MTSTNDTDLGQGAAETAEKVAAAGKQAVEAALKMGADVAAENCKNAAAFCKDQLHLVQERYNKAAVFGKDNLDAMTEAATALAAGWEAYLEGLVDYTKTAVVENVDLAQRYFAVRTPKDLMELQMETANKAVDRVVTQSTKMNKIATDTMTKAMEPIKGRIDGSVEAFLQSYAA